MAPLVQLLSTVQGASALAAMAVLLAVEAAHPFFAFWTNRRDRAVHALRNLALGLFNAVVVALAFAALWLAAAEWASDRGVGLLNVARDRAGLPTWAHVALAVLLLDAWTYAWHRLNHRIPLLWRFHRVHHADAQMDVTTASRFHIGEIVLSSLLRLPLIVALGVYAWELVAYEALMFAVVQLQHANVALPPRLERLLRRVIVTPGLHKVHHSRFQPETDSNYASLLSVWDRMFGSFRVREDLENLRLGLDDFDAPDDATVRGMLAMPLRPSPPGALDRDDV